LQNAAKAKSDGGEIELDLRPIENLHLNGAVGILYTKYKELQVANGGANLSGAQFVRAPHLTLNGGASYAIPLANQGRVELAADARYTSLQYYYITPQDTVNRYLLDQPGYTIANARISYTAPNDRWTLTAYVNNFLDTNYRNHSLPIGGSAAITGDVTQWGDPRTWGGSFTFRF
jgi:iron complex outermembrane receptor protein